MKASQVLANMTALNAAFQTAMVLYFSTRFAALWLESARKWVPVVLLIVSAGFAIQGLRLGDAPMLYVEWVGSLILSGVLALLVDGRFGLKSRPLVAAVASALLMVWASVAVEHAWGHTASGFGAAYGMRVIYLMPVFGTLRLLLSLLTNTIGWANAALTARRP